MLTAARFVGLVACVVVLAAGSLGCSQAGAPAPEAAPSRTSGPVVVTPALASAEGQSGYVDATLDLAHLN